jgi:hypothetical protein
MNKKQTLWQKQFIDMQPGYERALRKKKRTTVDMMDIALFEQMRDLQEYLYSSPLNLFKLKSQTKNKKLVEAAVEEIHQDFLGFQNSNPTDDRTDDWIDLLRLHDYLAELFDQPGGEKAKDYYAEFDNFIEENCPDCLRIGRHRQYPILIPTDQPNTYDVWQDQSLIGKEVKLSPVDSSRRHLESL